MTAIMMLFKSDDDDDDDVVVVVVVVVVVDDDDDDDLCSPKEVYIVAALSVSPSVCSSARLNCPGLNSKTRKGINKKLCTKQIDLMRRSTMQKKT